MNVTLTPHAAKLLESVRAQRQEPDEEIVEHALEVLAREERIELQDAVARQHAVSSMLEFVRRNRIHLGPGLSAKDLIHEGRRV
jgi:hypothetical protein